MHFTYTIKNAFKMLSANKSRALLTILGIVIGITAIILIMSLGEGAQNLILGEIQSMGSKTIVVIPGKMSGGISGMLATFSDSLKLKDYEDLKNKSNVPYAQKIMPIVFGSEVVSYESQIYRPTILGASGLFSEIFDVYPEEGRIFSDEEVSGYADVVIIGSEIKKELFGDSGGLNQRVKIKGKNFRVIGIFGARGKSTLIDFDTTAIIPFTTAQRYIMGIKYYNRIIIEADSEANIKKTVDDVTAVLRANHGITDPEKDDFTVQTQANAMDMVGTITGILTMFVAAVAAISLIVGGVGIMNIMLVSVTERTREIGLRKALGATEKNILMQFLFEAVILTGTGGLIGIILGAFLSSVIAWGLTRFANLEWVFVFPINAALIGMGVSVAIGLVFGLYPAKKAAKKSPIEALRYE